MISYAIQKAWEKASGAWSSGSVPTSESCESWQEAAADWLSDVMLCVKPFGSFGCGTCLPCSLNRRRMWTARLVLESYDHGDSVFVTLTYVDDPWSLVPRDLTNFLKRLRKSLNRPIRFFACGEYGDQSGRPHFHVILFGVSRLFDSEKIYQAWGHGFVDVGDVTPRSCAYVCGYLVKKDKRRWGSGVLQGRHPEYVRMSLKPGIGSCAIDSISKQLMDRGASSAVAFVGDVPSEVRIAGKKYPLGRYLRSLLRCAVGWESPKVPAEAVRQLALRKSLESLSDVKELERKRVHSAKKAEFKQKLRKCHETI